MSVNFRFWNTFCILKEYAVWDYRSWTAVTGVAFDFIYSVNMGCINWHVYISVFLPLNTVLSDLLFNLFFYIDVKSENKYLQFIMTNSKCYGIWWVGKISHLSSDKSLYTIVKWWWDSINDWVLNSLKLILIYYQYPFHVLFKMSILGILSQFYPKGIYNI